MSSDTLEQETVSRERETVFSAFGGCYVSHIVFKFGTGGHGLLVEFLRAAAADSVAARRGCDFWYVAGAVGPAERVLDCGVQESMVTGFCRGTTNDVCRVRPFQITVLLPVALPALGFVGG